MLRTLSLLLAVLAMGPLACDDGTPDDDADADETTSATEPTSGDDDDDESTGDEEGTGEAIDPTPVPHHNPPLAKECHATGKGERIGNCDP